jgi:hypothetical protein
MCSVAVELKTGSAGSIGPKWVDIAPQRDSLMLVHACQAWVPFNETIFMKWSNVLKIDSLRWHLAAICWYRSARLPSWLARQLPFITGSLIAVDKGFLAYGVNQQRKILQLFL